MNSLDLPSVATYFPIEKGKYEVAPGLRSLGTDFGNGLADQRVFQIDSDFKRYRKNKLDCRKERLSKYHATAQQSDTVTAAVNQFLIGRLSEEYPGLFKWAHNKLECQLTGEILEFNSDFELQSSSAPEYVSSFDALCSQIQEDVAVMSTNGASNWLSAIHLCSPSHWAAEDKIGKDFATIHKPVPGIAKINQAANAYIDAMVKKGPYVRFVWGMSVDGELNHHPESVRERAHRASDLSLREDAFSDSSHFLRVERQVLWGLPEVGAAVFCIRVYTTDIKELVKDERKRTLLRSGLLSMAPDERVYKGVDAEKMDFLLTYLS